MDINTARQQICDAGRRLLDEGLVARTWGNISLRCDERSFLVTPGGRTYDDLEPGDIVRVFMEDLSYGGTIRPSSEKGLHAEIYRNRPDINAIIHTHQNNASIVAAAGRSIPVNVNGSGVIKGKTIGVAVHAMPGSRSLARATARCLGDGNAALMANHGAVCAGPDMESAFRVAGELEKLCGKYIEDGYLHVSGEAGPFDPDKMRQYYLEHFSRRHCFLKWNMK